MECLVRRLYIHAAVHPASGRGEQSASAAARTSKVTPAPLVEINSLYVDNLSGNVDGPGGKRAREQKYIFCRVVNPQVPAFRYVLNETVGKTLQPGHIAVVRRNDDRSCRGIEYRQAAAHFALRRIDITHIAAGVRPDEKLPIAAHIHAVMITISDDQAIGHRHRSEINKIESAAEDLGSRRLAAEIVWRGIAC